jgi:hypothetical protein
MVVRSGISWSWPRLLILLLAQLWLAHAFVFFAHEYAHTFTAWLLGWKSSPFDLHVPPSSPTVWLIQMGIDQNVDEAPIFASGKGSHAAIIALAGALLGNALITLPLSRLTYAHAKRHALRGWAMLAFWVCTASVGNLFDYVPIRTFTLGGDMGSVQRGFEWSPWTVLVVFGIPTALVLGYFLFRIVPATLKWLFPESASQRALIAIVTAFVMFAFFGAAGWAEGGPISHQMSVISVFVMAPAVAILEIILSRQVGTATGRRASK